MNYILKHNKAIITAIVAIAILSGITRIFSYKVGYYMLLSTVILYLVYRLLYFAATIVKRKQFDKTDKQYLALFIVLLAVVGFNNFDLLDAPFISLILLLVDYIISMQSPIKDKTA